LARVIQQEIKKPLADKLLFGDLITGGHVKVDIVDNKAVFDVTAAKATPKKSEDEEGDDEAPDAAPPSAETPKEPVEVR
jgi:hypothetical protein